jgi:hypothetical protein
VRAGRARARAMLEKYSATVTCLADELERKGELEADEVRRGLQGAAGSKQQNGTPDCAALGPPVRPDPAGQPTALASPPPGDSHKGPAAAPRA